MTLRLHRAPRADQLAEALGTLLATPPDDPFAQELVLVPARGVERWLSQRLSHRLGRGDTDDGVCAGVVFRSPRTLVAEVTGLHHEGGDDDPWAPDALVWPLLGVVDASAGEKWCSTLGAHLGHGQTGEEGELRRGRRYAVARRLARLFASYAVQRPGLLADWEAGIDSDGVGARIDPDLLWQPELWRRLVAVVGAPSPAVRHARVLDELRAGPQAADLPARLSLFGHTRLAVTEVELLAALGEHRDVHVWLPHASDALWRSLTGLAGAVPRRDDTSHLQAGHPLLASLGRDLRELERTLLVHVPMVEPVETEPVDEDLDKLDHRGSLEPRGSLLSWLQADIAANATVDPTGRVLDVDDRSVQVHACHGPARQVEVLREVLLGLLADDTTLEPRDILVMCPDIEAYAPLVEAAFGMGPAVAGGHPGQLLQVRLADRALTQTNPLLAVLGTLLDLAGGRAQASAVLDLVAADPVRRRFGLADNDLETITGWVERAGVRWAYDEQHRAPYGLDGYVQNTWRFGLDRVLAGVAMSDDAQADGPGWIGTTLPLDDVGSTSIELAGRLAELLDRLQAVTDRLIGSHPVEHWLDTLREGLDALTAVARGEEWQTGQVQRELTALAGDAGRPGGTLELRLPDVRALMAERLAGQPTRANFRTGTLTVCTMVPMRSVPHRVVCLLGLDDGVFPRAPAVDGDDVLARTPLTGERDLRSEDRQLLLDAIMATRERLVVTYSGFNETTGQHRAARRPARRAARRTRRHRRWRPCPRVGRAPAPVLRRPQPPAAPAVLLRPCRARGSPGRCRRPGRGRVAGDHRPAAAATGRPRARLAGEVLPAPGAGVPARPARRRPARRGRGGRRRTTRRARQPRAVGRGRPAAARPAPRSHHRPGPRHRVAARRPAAGSARLAPRSTAHRGGGAGRGDGRVGHPGAARRARSTSTSTWVAVGGSGARSPASTATGS